MVQKLFNLSSFFTISLLSGILLLGGCSKTDEDKFDDRPVGELYHQGLDLLKDKNYEKSAKVFDEVERQHPYSEWATQAQLMSAYAHYEGQKYEKALAAIDGFIALHPAHKNIAYAYYLQGLCYYEQLSPVERDQKITELAYESFEELINRFPKTPYAKDAKYKMVLLRDMRAGKEMDVGRYYQSRKGYVGAINRFQEVIHKYENTTHTPEALHRLVEVYLALGLKKEALTTASVLSHNYQDNPWYAETYLLMKGQDFRPEIYRKESNWMDKVWKSKPKV